MALKITPESVKQERDIWQVNRWLRETAVELAVLGDVDSARSLASILASTFSESRSIQSERGLTFAWRATGQWPEDASDAAKTDEALSEIREDCKRSSKFGFPNGGDVYDESGLKACLDVKDVYGADSTTGSSAMTKGVRLVQALDISLKLHYSGARLITDSGVRRSSRIASQPSVNTVNSPLRIAVADLDDKSAEIVRSIIARWNANCQIQYLAEAESLWPYYLAGLFADAFSLDGDEVHARGQALVLALRERLEHGSVPSPLNGMSMKELLETAAKNSNDRMTEDGHPENDGTFFKAGASEEDLEALEQRLQTVLPDDYKEFLKVTNGFGVGESGIHNGYFPDPALHSIAQVKWDEEEYFQLPVDLLQLPNEIEQLASSHWKERSTEPDGHLDWEGSLPIFDRVLELGTCDRDNIWLVHPQLVEQCRDAYHEMHRNANKKQRKLIVLAMEAFAGSKEAFEQMHWCCVTWAAGGSALMVPYASFRDYLEHKTESSMQKRWE